MTIHKKHAKTKRKPHVKPVGSFVKTLLRMAQTKNSKGRAHHVVRRAERRVTPHATAGNPLGGPTKSYRVGKFRRRNKKKLSSFRNKVFDALVPVDVYNRTDTVGFTTLENECAYVMPGIPLMDNRDLQIISRFIPSVNVVAGVSEFLPDPNTGIHGAKRFVLKRASKKVQISNFSNAIVNLRAYKCKLRSDLPPSHALGAAFGNTTFNNDVLANLPEGNNTILYGGFADGQNPLSTPLVLANQYKDPGSTLFDNALFCSLFKIVKVQTSKVMPGEAVDFNVEYNKHRYVDTEKISSTDYILTKPIYFWVFQSWGELGVQVTIPPAQGKFGVVQHKLGFFMRYHYEYQWLANNTKQKTYDQTFSAVAAGTLVFINPDTDVQITESYAP